MVLLDVWNHAVDRLGASQSQESNIRTVRMTYLFGTVVSPLNSKFVSCAVLTTKTLALVVFFQQLGGYNDEPNYTMWLYLG